MIAFYGREGRLEKVLARGLAIKNVLAVAALLGTGGAGDEKRR